MTSVSLEHEEADRSHICNVSLSHSGRQGRLLAPSCCSPSGQLQVTIISLERAWAHIWYPDLLGKKLLACFWWPTGLAFVGPRGQTEKDFLARHPPQGLSTEGADRNAISQTSPEEDVFIYFKNLLSEGPASINLHKLLTEILLFKTLTDLGTLLTAGNH